MADFPSSIFSPRTTENLPGITYDDTKTTEAFAEDYSIPAAEIEAIESTLGTNPQGAYATVKAWLTDLASGIADYFSSASIDPGHLHSTLVAPDGSPNPAVSVDNDGNVGFGTSTPSATFEISNGNPTFKFTKTGTYAGDASFYNDGNFHIAGENTGQSGNLFLSGNVIAFRASRNSGNLVTLKNSNLGVGTISPTISDGNGIHSAGKIFRLGTSKTPSSAGDTGNTGEICWDSTHIYVCVATNTWKRTPITTW